MDIGELYLNKPVISNSASELLARTADKDACQTEDKIEDVSKKFEGVFLNQMLKQSQQTIDQMDDQEGEEEGDEEADTTKEQYQSLYWTLMADNISEKGGLGFWKQIYQEIKAQTGQNPAQSASILDQDI